MNFLLVSGRDKLNLFLVYPFQKKKDPHQRDRGFFFVAVGGFAAGCGRDRKLVLLWRRRRLLDF